MNKKVKIFRAGITSFLAMIMLKKAGFEVELVIRGEEELEQKHFALLRFKTDLVEKYTGIKLKKVTIQKSIWDSAQHFDKSNIKFENEYSMKVSNTVMNRSIGDLSVGTRYSPPADFWDQLISLIDKDDIKIIPDGDEYDKEFFNKEHITISTINMKHVQHMLRLKEQFNFDQKFREIRTINIDLTDKIDCQVNQTIYIPSTHMSMYRMSLEEGRVTAEFAERNHKTLNEEKMDDCDKALTVAMINTAFGLPFFKVDDLKIELHKQKFGKIVPIDEDKRKSFIYNLTQDYGIYSLGRFAVWRPIMIDDVVQDIEKIMSWINSKNDNPYDQAKAIIKN